jgi:hypothetical protein
MMGVSSSARDLQASFPFPEEEDRLAIEIEVTDPEVVAEVLARPPGENRDRFVREAFRLGVLSLRMASGKVDAVAIRSAGERLVADVRELLAERASDITNEMTRALRDYFDPESGLVPQRLAALVRKDGELSQVLASHVGGNESLLARTLASHLGEHSPLFKMLSPSEAQGIKAQLEKAVEGALCEQRRQILSEFSLDRRDSALRRLVDELEQRHTALRTDLAGQITSVVEEFSLDQPNSALSRLVGRVESAQRTITSEFSLDRDDSALSRMSRMIADFRSEVRETLAALSSQRREAERSTRHGLAFEEALGEVVSALAQRQQDVYQATGATTGAIRHCKVGDLVVELGPDSPAPGARVVWEAKEEARFDLKRALAEIEQARKNRGAQVGVFVFSAKTAPAGLDLLTRYGDDLIVVWDAQSADDLIVRAAYTTARALSLRVEQHSAETDGLLREIELATRAVEKQIKYLEEIRKSADTVRSSGERIGERAARMALDLTEQVDRLDRQLAALRTAGY